VVAGGRTFGASIIQDLAVLEPSGELTIVYGLPAVFA
jgi:hypothetical protein